MRTLIQEIWEDSFAVLAPSLQEAVLVVGHEVKVVCYRKDARYEFTARIKQYVPGEPPLYRLSYPDTYQRFQFRAHVRVKVALKFRYAFWPPEEWIQQPPLPHQNGITINLSAGGVQMALPEPVQIGNSMYLELPLPKGEQEILLHLKAKVKRRALREIDGQKMHITSAVFEDISLKQEDQIMAFVFQHILHERSQGC